jgi:hypothetical protein
MLLANVSATQAVEVNAENQFYANENFKNAIVNSAQYAYEIKDFKKAGEIMEMGLQTK